ncbi:MAG: DJ-1/PfpI family protein [Bacteroidales bacterium]|nr:DJ-1/PfpI family protein [Bacteroidales bacterium]
MKGVYVFLAEGFEEIEALATVDILRRGGIDVKTVSISHDRTVRGAHGIPVIADCDRDEFDGRQIPGSDSGDVMIFPGGMPGAKNLAGDYYLMEQMKGHFADGGTVAAICAAPGLVASQLPGLEGRKVTCYDGFEEALIDAGAEYTGEPAVTDGNLITGRGPGCAARFALEIVRKLKGDEAAGRVHAGLLA